MCDTDRRISCSCIIWRGRLCYVLYCTSTEYRTICTVHNDLEDDAGGILTPPAQHLEVWWSNATWDVFMYCACTCTTCVYNLVNEGAETCWRCRVGRWAVPVWWALEFRLAKQVSVWRNDLKWIKAWWYDWSLDLDVIICEFDIISRRLYCEKYYIDVIIRI